MNNGYSICFNKWALDKNIKSEFRLLVIISSLTAETGYCFASNKYLANIFNETEISISNKIKKLEKNNYIEIEYEKRGCEVTARRIRLKNILIDDYNFFKSTIKENFKENNISINNTSINKKEIYKEKRFKKPTLEEVKAYCQERGNNVDAEHFIDHYESNGWKVGKNPMKDWKATVRNWERSKIGERKETRYERERRLLEEMCKDE